jgi:hypothetical protein
MPSQRQKNSGYLLPETVTGHQLQCVTLMIPRDPNYVAAFKGKLYELARYWSWERPGPPGNTDAREAAKYWLDLIEDTLVLDECNPETSGCYEFAPNSAIIEYFPNDPYKTPELIPEGYYFPPWYVAPALNLIGANEGDVVSDIARITSGSSWFDPGLNSPRFRVSITGTGVIELHLVNVFNGGVAQIQVDGDLLSLRYVELNRDLISIPNETQDVIVIPLEITTPGDHFIDVTFLPWLNDNPIPFGFGGGLRKIVLCGFDQPPPEAVDVPQLRFNSSTCSFEVSYNNGLSWEVLPGWDAAALDCFQGPPGEPGTPGTPGEPGQSTDFPTQTPGEDGPNKRCDMASYMVDLVLPTLVQDSIAARQESTDFISLVGILMSVVAAGLAIAATGGAAIPAFAIAGIGAAGAGTTYEAHIQGVDIQSLENQLTPQFWQDVKCAIYCKLPSDGILTLEACDAIADEVMQINGVTEAKTTVALQFRTFSEAARGRWSVVGALYDGQNCDLCGCDDGCAVENIVWAEIGETPAGWDSPTAMPLGITDPNGLLAPTGGTVEYFYYGGQAIQGTRTPNDYWRATRIRPPNETLLVNRRTFAEPCTIFDVMFDAGSNTTNSKFYTVVAELPDGSHQVIAATRHSATAFGDYKKVYTFDDPITVKALYFHFQTGSASGTTTFNLRIRGNGINAGSYP